MGVLERAECVHTHVAKRDVERADLHWEEVVIVYPHLRLWGWGRDSCYRDHTD